MSNAAVVKLQKKRIGKYLVWLDDNFAESIHLHINDARVDFTREKFELFCEELSKVLEDYIGVESFKIRNFDVTYLASFLYEKMSYIQDVKFDEVLLSKLLCGRRSKKKPIQEEICYRQLNGEKGLTEKPSISDHINQTREERLNEVYSQVMENGYPYNDEYIVLLEDTNLIIDGMHRASSLLKIYGDIKIPVIRIYFKSNKHESGKKKLNLYRKGKKIVKKCLKLVEAVKRKRNNKRIENEISCIFHNR